MVVRLLHLFLGGGAIVGHVGAAGNAASWSALQASPSEDIVLERLKLAEATGGGLCPPEEASCDQWQ